MFKKWLFFESDFFFFRDVKKYFRNAPGTLEGRGLVRETYQMHMKNENKRCARFERTRRSAFRFHSAKGKHPKIRALAEVLATLASALRALAEVIFLYLYFFTTNIF